MTKHKPTILITNDDGITAPGIKVLIEQMSALGDIIVVAPDSPQSGMGHAVTIAKPLRLDKVEVYEGVRMYQCSGTPVDCVKLAVNKVLHKKPDLLVSGINHGFNSSINVIYSGTMSAAMEGAIEGIPSVGFSLGDFRQDADFSATRPYVSAIAKEILANGLPLGTLLNVNFPVGHHIKGLKVCRQAIAKWSEEFDERIDPHGRPYFWLTGKFLLNDKGEDTDEYALNEGYASVVPVHFDFTSYNAIPTLKNWNFNL